MYYDAGSPSLRKALSRPDPGGFLLLEEVSDNVLQVLITLDFRERELLGSAWHLAFAVDAVAAWLDFYKHCPFRAFDLMFQQARYQIEARSLRTRNKPPR